MRLPGAALLIVIGLLVLWLAVTGDFLRLAQAWDFVRGNSNKLPTTASNTAPGASGIYDFSTLHVGATLMQPDISATIPGGLI